MESSQNIKVCIFCCKNISNSSKNNVGIEAKIEKFLTFLRRIVATGSQWEILEKWTCSMAVISINGCCNDCMKKVDEFCEVYKQIKCLELQLNWKLSRLLDSMNLANKIPSRWKFVNKVLKEDMSNDPINVLEVTKVFRTFRENIIKAANSKLVTSQPRVQLDRNEQNINITLRNESVPKIIWSPVRIRDEDNSLDEQPCNSYAQANGDADDNSTVFIDCHDEIAKDIAEDSPESLETTELFEETPIETKLEFPFPHSVPSGEIEAVSQTACSLVIENVTSMVPLSSVLESETDDSNASSTTTDEDSIESIDGSVEDLEDTQNIDSSDKKETNVRLALVAQKYLQKYRNFKRPKYKQYTKTELACALEAVQKGMRRHTAARKFNIPSRTLYQRVDKHGNVLPSKRTGKTILETGENVVVKCSVANKDLNKNTRQQHKPIVKKTQLERNPYKKYTKKELAAAIKDVQDGKLSALQAARKHEIPSRTVYERLKKLKVMPTAKYNKECRKINLFGRNHIELDESSSDQEFVRRYKSKRFVYSDSDSSDS